MLSATAIAVSSVLLRLLRLCEQSCSTTLSRTWQQMRSLPCLRSATGVTLRLVEAWQHCLCVALRCAISVGAWLVRVRLPEVADGARTVSRSA